MGTKSNQVKMDANRLGLLLRSTMDLNNWLQTNDIDGKERHRLSLILDNIYQALTNSDVVVFTDESYELFNHRLPGVDTSNEILSSNSGESVDMGRYYDNLFQSDEMMVLNDDLYTEIEDTDLVDFADSESFSKETIVDKVQAALDAQPVDGDLHGLKDSIETSNTYDDDFYTDVIRREEKVVKSRNEYEEKASNTSLVETFSAGVDQLADDEGISFDDFDEEIVLEEGDNQLGEAVSEEVDLDEGFDDDLPGMSASSVLSNSFSSFDEDFIGSDFFDEGSDA